MQPRIRHRHLARALLLATLGLLPACAATPPSRTETTAIREIREEYFRSFPNGRFNDQIVRGRVVKGMSLFEVLASWGIPDARAVKVEDNRERWVYVLVEDNDLDWVRYDFIFRANELVEWEMTRNVASGPALEVPEHPVSTMQLPAWAVGNRGSGAPAR